MLGLLPLTPQLQDLLSFSEVAAQVKQSVSQAERKQSRVKGAACNKSCGAQKLLLLLVPQPGDLLSSLRPKLPQVLGTSDQSAPGTMPCTSDLSRSSHKQPGALLSATLHTLPPQAPERQNRDTNVSHVQSAIFSGGGCPSRPPNTCRNSPRELMC